MTQCGQDDSWGARKAAFAFVPEVIMYLLYCDESNLQPQSGDFFIYAGIVIPGQNAQALSDRIRKLRQEAGIPSDFLLKYAPGPEDLTHEQFVLLRQGIVEAAIEQDCSPTVSLILHDVATSANEARRNEINRIAYHFDCLLHGYDDHGLILVDRFEDGQIDAHLREKFSVGLRGLPYSDPYRLRRIVGYHYSAIGQSHFGSLVDIAVGGLRDAVNIHTRQQADEMDKARKILQVLAPLFHRTSPSHAVSELSLFFSPKFIDFDPYREKYKNLHAFFTECGAEPEQSIPDQRPPL